MKPIAIASLLSLGLVGCQSTGPHSGQMVPTNTGNAMVNTVAAPQPAANPFALSNSQYSKPKKIWSDSNSKTKRYVRPDGTVVTKTTKTSANVSFNQNAAASLVGALVGGAMVAGLNNGATRAPALPAVSRSQLAGSWTLYTASTGKTCNVRLDNMEWFGAYKGWGGINCPRGLNGNMKWNYLGDQFMLMNHTGQILARFQRNQANNWSGVWVANNAQMGLTR